MTPLTALKFAELSLKAGIPKGVINIIPGSGKGVNGDMGIWGIEGSRQLEIHLVRTRSTALCALAGEQPIAEPVGRGRGDPGA